MHRLVLLMNPFPRSASVLFQVLFVSLILSRIPGVAFGQEELPIWIKPPSLQANDRIAIVAPSGPVDEKLLRDYAEALRLQGFQVELPEDIGRKNGYLAGTDEQRADEMNRMIRDARIQAIFPARGGYGLTRILDRIDYAFLATHPKVIIGYSDITALHLAVAKKCRLVTFHSPVPLSNLYREQEKDYQFAAQSFRRAVLSQSYFEKHNGYVIETPPSMTTKTLVGGKARGRLLGGNLTLVSSTMGTPYEIETDQAILFFEDVNEAPYRIDRMLSQLRLAGKLERAAGIVVGDLQVKTDEERAEIRKILVEYLAHLRKPVITDYPCGHIALNATLPHGALVELNADLGTLRLLENPVRVP